MKWLYSVCAFFVLSIVHADDLDFVYSRQRQDQFYSGFVYDQVESFEDAGLLYAEKGRINIVLTNKNQKVGNSENVWITILGKEPDTEAPCIVRIDSNGRGERVVVGSEVKSSQEF